MIYCVHSRDVGKQSLGGADVGGCLVSSDVLFSGLESKSETFVVINIFGNTNHTARHVTDIFVFGGKETFKIRV